MSKQLPSIGRIVHYTNLGDADGKYPPETQAAIITGVYRENALFPDTKHAVPVVLISNNEAQSSSALLGTDSMTVDLKVFYRTGVFDLKQVRFSETPARGHWNWPPYVAAKKEEDDIDGAAVAAYESHAFYWTQDPICVPFVRLPADQQDGWRNIARAVVDFIRGKK